MHSPESPLSTSQPSSPAGKEFGIVPWYVGEGRNSPASSFSLGSSISSSSSSSSSSSWASGSSLPSLELSTVFSSCGWGAVSHQTMRARISLLASLSAQPHPEVPRSQHPKCSRPFHTSRIVSPGRGSWRGLRPSSEGARKHTLDSAAGASASAVAQGVAASTRSVMASQKPIVTEGVGQRDGQLATVVVGGRWVGGG